jgi:acetate kinase
LKETILVVNSGSSSIKFSMYHARARPKRNDLIVMGECAGIGHQMHFTASDHAGQPQADEHVTEGATHEDALASILRWLDAQYKDCRLIAAGHRVVHGGPSHAVPVLIGTTVLAELRRLVPLAPLHQPHNLAAIDALSKLHPGLPQVACFDTAFHHSQPEVATTFALPRDLTAEGIRRYGFHGLSYEYIASTLPDVIGQDAADGRIVVAHLGNGASMCAMHRRKSVATTMSFTTLDGLPMSSRCGSLDPGVILYLLQEKRITAEAIANLLYRSSGLLGVSGVSDEMKTLLASESPHAAEAVSLFVYRVSRELGSLASALGGLDALVFTAGIGEHAPEIRRRVCELAAWLGVKFDPAANAAGGPRISEAGSRVSVWVIPTDEDLAIGRHTWDVINDRREQHEQ